MESQTNTQPVNIQNKPKSNKLLWVIIVTLLLSLVLIIGIALGYVLSNQLGINNQSNTDTSNTDKVSNDDTNVSDDQTIDDEGVDPCNKTFTSSYLDLSFDYDSCNWEASEELTTPGAIYNVVTMEYKDGSKVILEGYELGMGGGYSDCVNVREFKFLTDDIARAQLSESSNFVYWNAKNQFAFKGYNGSEHGDSDFNAFFEYLSEDYYADTNACYVGSGSNKVELLNPSENLTEVWQRSKDLVITMEARDPSDKFLEASDNLVLSVFEAI